METLLKNKTQKEKIKIKSDEIVKANFKGVFEKDNHKIKVHKIEKIEGGIEIHAQAWENNKQIGFGKFGQIDIERFRIFNPPVLIYDENGEIVRQCESIRKNAPKEYRLSWNPVEAIRESLLHTIKVSGKRNSQIIKDEIGRTTSTLYPEVGGGGGNTTADGQQNRTGVNETYSNIRTGAGNNSSNSSQSTDCITIIASATVNQFQRMTRSRYSFDSSVVGSDNIDSSTLSIYATGADEDLDAEDIGIVSNNPVNANDVVDADYAYTRYGTTDFATRVLTGNWGTNEYEDFSLNASGIANINKSGVSSFGIRSGWDIDNSFGGTWSSGLFNAYGNHFADFTGTSTDPKLVIEHSSVGKFLTLLGVGS